MIYFIIYYVVAALIFYVAELKVPKPMSDGNIKAVYFDDGHVDVYIRDMALLRSHECVIELLNEHADKCDTSLFFENLHFIGPSIEGCNRVVSNIKISILLLKDVWK